MLFGCSSVRNVDCMNPFSIGMSPAMWTVNPLSMLGAPTPLFRDRSTLCYLNITLTTDRRRRPTAPNRAAFQETLIKNGFCVSGGLPTTDYWRALCNSIYVISPEGNGIDCHRTYEALMAGCIPIVEQAHESHLRFLYGNVPMLFTKDYSEITPDYLRERLMEFLFRTDWNYDKLFYSHATEPERARERSKCWAELTNFGRKNAAFCKTEVIGKEEYRVFHRHQQSFSNVL